MEWGYPSRSLSDARYNVRTPSMGNFLKINLESNWLKITGKS